MNSVALGVNIFETPQWTRCKENLLPFKSKMSFYCLQHQEDKVNSNGFERLNCIQKRAKNFIQLSNSTKPLVYELLDGLASVGKDYFVFMNSDIILSETAVEWMLNQNQYETACFSRVNIDPENQRNFEVWAPYGFDVFFIRTSWWKSNREKFLSLPNTYAEPCWDLAYAATLHLNSSCYYHNKIPIIYHIGHEGRWNVETLEGSYSQNIFVGLSVFKVWYDYFGKTVLSRKYVNGEISSDRINEELAIEKKVFGR